ncbi:CBS domain-containing protein [Amycolatopsis sp. NPDC006131]|uniref:CBS domain-containing protein n=1 Tax=Amycolatopsis sp. NPDC006131 TaxID=3156731 RepID=UPI0033AEA693
MRISDLMSSPVVGVTPNTTPEEAAATMLERGYTTLPVLTESGELVGLVTESDLGAARLLARGGPDDGAMLGTVPVSVAAIMRRPVVTADPDAEVADVAAALVDSRQRCLPITHAGRIVGIVSWRDLLAHLVAAHR